MRCTALSLALASLTACAAAGSTPPSAATTAQPPSAYAPLAAPAVSAPPSAAATVSGVADPRLAVRVLGSGRRAADAGSVVAAALVLLEGDPRGATALHVEAIEQPGPGAAVATVLGFRQGEPLWRRAVAVAITDDTVAATGATWALPLPATTDGPPPALLLTPADDPALLSEVRAALRAGGFDAERLLSVALAVDAWPVIAHLRSAEVADQVWLRRHQDALIVAGSNPPMPAANTGDAP